ncbi:MAG: hypothetical protein NT067_05120 [Candidatus Diapherotrites archaeon]|nr:hypothetical protein [Candidatus Diapherotrites archaeon]
MCIKVDFGKGEVLLSINKTFYPKALVEQAIREMPLEGEISKKEEKGRVVLRVKPASGIDLEALGFEFFNYLLFLVKNKAG